MAPGGARKGKELKDGDNVVVVNLAKGGLHDGVATAAVLADEAEVVELSVIVPVTPEKPRLFYVVDMAKRTFASFGTLVAAEEFVKNMQTFSPNSSKSLRISGFQSESEVVSFMDNFCKLNPVGTKQAPAQRS